MIPLPTNIPQIGAQGNFPAPTPHEHSPFMHKPQPIPEKPKDISLIVTSYDLLIDVDSPFDDVLIKTEYRCPTEMDFIILPSLEKQIDQGQISKWDLPCQKDIDKIMKQINRKVLRRTHLPLSLCNLRVAYLSSPHFKDIYVYLAQNRTPKNRKACRCIETMSESYMLLDTFLFKITHDKARDKYTTVLCIPTSKVDMVSEQYHTSFKGSHTGITKCYMTINQRYYIPNLAHHIHAYITGCHLCQLLKAGPRFNRPHQRRININVPALSKISLDIKYMPKVYAGKNTEGENLYWSFLLVLLCEISNFVILVPLTSMKTLSKSIS